MKAGKKIEKRLEDRLHGYQSIINNLKGKNPRGYTKPGSRKK